MTDLSRAGFDARSSAITTITTPFFHISVNCYLVKTNSGYVLIDTGLPSQRNAIANELECAGCQPGTLKLILLTHGDSDHCGNAAYFQKRFETEIAMHPDDVGMVKEGDMFWNRQPPNPLIRLLFGALFGLRTSNRFTPDWYVEEGESLSNYGLEATVLHLPGHSKGSIGILTATGDLFCGDLLGNIRKPELWSLIDDPAAAKNSIAKLNCLNINTVYPGHGRPFSMEQLRLDGG